jgi:hypothetical protein
VCGRSGLGWLVYERKGKWVWSFINIVGMHLYAESVDSGCYWGFMISWAQAFATLQA